MANLEQSGSRIPGAQSIKLTFSLRVTFYFTKAKNRTKKSITALKLLLCVKVPFLLKNATFLPKYADNSKIKEILIVKGIFSETTYVYVLTYQISSF